MAETLAVSQTLPCEMLKVSSNHFSDTRMSNGPLTSSTSVFDVDGRPFLSFTTLHPSHGATARVRALASRYGSLAEGSAFEEQVANLLPQQNFWISLIQQPEPSGSEARESRVRNGVRERF
jgi:hypothetical protein